MGEKVHHKSDEEIMTYYWGTFQFTVVSFNAVAVSKGRPEITAVPLPLWNWLS
jgi:hypothetical protein